MVLQSYQSIEVNDRNLTHCTSVLYTNSSRVEMLYNKDAEHDTVGGSNLDGWLVAQNDSTYWNFDLCAPVTLFPVVVEIVNKKHFRPGRVILQHVRSFDSFVRRFPARFFRFQKDAAIHVCFTSFWVIQFQTFKKRVKSWCEKRHWCAYHVCPCYPSISALPCLCMLTG